MRKKMKFVSQYRELVAYIAAGVLTTAVNYVVYNTLTVLCGLDINLNNTIAWAVAVIVAFLTNKAVVGIFSNIFFCGRVFDASTML